jgi:hypothetical protein
LGSLVQRSLQIEAALFMGFHVTLSEITAEEFAALAILKEERFKREAEMAKNPNAG